MNSGKRKYSSARYDQYQDYKVSSSPFALLDNSDLRFVPSPSYGDLSNGQSSLIFHDPNYSPFIPASQENRVTGLELFGRESKEIYITPFPNIVQRRSVERPAENILAAQGTTKVSHDESFTTNLQEQPEEGKTRNLRSTAQKSKLLVEEQWSTVKPKTKRLRKITSQTKRSGKRFPCNHCEKEFMTPQGLGGHMSRAHPGKSEVYRKKKSTRKTREYQRHRLRLAKKKFFKELKYSYDELLMTVEGRKLIKSLVDRKRIRKIQRNLTAKELNDYIDKETIRTYGFDNL